MKQFINGLELADKIHFFYRSGPSSSEGINTALATHLDPSQYRQFCEMMKSVPLKNTFAQIAQYFDEKFLITPVSIQHIVTDEQIRNQWHIGTIMETIKELMK